MVNVWYLARSLCQGKKCSNSHFPKWSSHLHRKKLKTTKAKVWYTEKKGKIAKIKDHRRNNLRMNFLQKQMCCWPDTGTIYNIPTYPCKPLGGKQHQYFTSRWLWWVLPLAIFGIVFAVFRWHSPSLVWFARLTMTTSPTRETSCNCRLYIYQFASYRLSSQDKEIITMVCWEWGNRP